MSAHCCGFVRGSGGGLVRWGGGVRGAGSGVDRCLLLEKNENYEDYWSGSKFKLPSIVHHQSYGYRDRFPRLIEEMAVIMTNGGHIDKWRLPCQMAVTVTDSLD